jgi:hypothetical protein
MELMEATSIAIIQLLAEAGSFLPHHTTVGGIRIYLHHVIWVFYTNGNWAKDKLDHKDGNVFNSKIANLREATNLQNFWNQRLFSSNNSGVSGVHWNKRSEKWYVRIVVNILNLFG